MNEILFKTKSYDLAFITNKTKKTKLKGYLIEHINNNNDAYKLF
jgi:hypothetical protein